MRVRADLLRHCWPPEDQRRWLRGMTDERDLSGTVLANRYRVLTRIGSGGMGTIYAGEHLEVGRKVAIKILRPEIGARPALVERFRREARYIARIEHEHVVECLDLGITDDGLMFYVMEWLRGEDLQVVLKRERRLPWPRARAILAQLCRALAAAHEQGVVHRDLKPGNLFLIRRADNPDFLKVLDFGIAKLMVQGDNAEVLTRLGEVIGTTPYMAPELAAGEAIDHRIDVYAAGVILFQLLSGRLPFRGKTPRQVLTAILQSEAPALTAVDPQLVVSPALEAVLRRAMHRDLESRFPDMAALHDALLELPDDACVRIDSDTPGTDPSASEWAMAASLIDPAVGTPQGDSDGGVARPTAMTRISGPHVAATEPESPAPAPPRRARRGLLAGLGALTVTAGLALAALQLGLLPVDRSESLAAAEPLVAATPNITPEAPAIVSVVTVEEAVAPQTSPPLADAASADAKPRAADGEPRNRRGEGRTDFDEVMQRASTRVRVCLAQAGLKTGTRVRFDIAVEAKTGRISAANPRDPHRERAGLGACVVEATRGATVRPPPANEWRRSYEFTS